MIKNSLANAGEARACVSPFWMAFFCLNCTFWYESLVHTHRVRSLPKPGIRHFSKGAWFLLGLPRWCSGKESACQAGDPASISGSGRFPGEGNGTPLQDSRLGNSTERGAWRAIGRGVAKSRTRRSTHECSAHTRTRLGPFRESGRVETDTTSHDKKVSEAQAVTVPRVMGLIRCHCFGSQVTASP